MVYSIMLDYGVGPKKIMEYDPGVESDDMKTPIGELLKDLLSFCPNGIHIQVNPQSGGN